MDRYEPIFTILCRGSIGDGDGLIWSSARVANDDQRIIIIIIIIIVVIIARLVVIIFSLVRVSENANRSEYATILCTRDDFVFSSSQ